MAVKKLKTHTEIAAAELAERTYTTLKQVQTDLEKIATSVADNLNLLKAFQKNIETAANDYVIDVSTPNVHTSPVGRSNFKPELVKSLNKKFAIIQSLWVAKAALATMEAQIRSAKTLGSDQSTALSDLVSIRKSITRGLEEAGQFLQRQTEKNAPEEFVTSVRNIQKLVARCIAYGDTTTFSYMFPQEANLCFCSYIELKDIIDDKGVRVPALYIVVSLVLSPGTMGKKQYFMDVLHEFEPPSEAILTSEINPAKIATVANELADLLQVSNFSNSIKRIPISLLLNPEKLKPEMFSSGEFIATIGSTENGLFFVLKPTVQDKAVVDKIQAQLFLDVRNLIANTRARMSPSITFDTNEDGAKCTKITYNFIRGKDAPSASKEDLEFLKERFNLSDKAVNAILVNINKD